MAKVQYLWVDQELGGFNLGLVVPLDAGGRFLCTSRDGNGINSRHSMHHANSHGPMNHTFPFRLSTQQDVNSAVVLIPFRTRAQGSQDDKPLVSLQRRSPDDASGPRSASCSTQVKTARREPMPNPKRRKYPAVMHILGYTKRRAGSSQCALSVTVVDKPKFQVQYVSHH